MNNRISSNPSFIHLVHFGYKFGPFVIGIAHILIKVAGQILAHMDQSRWQKIEPILDKALTFSDKQQQEKFIKKTCDPDCKLYKQVRSLLVSIREANRANFLEKH